jgi:hypothetical protein
VRPLSSEFVYHCEPNRQGASGAYRGHGRVDPLPRTSLPSDGHDHRPLELAVDKGPVEHVKTRCPNGHVFTPTTDSLPAKLLQPATPVPAHALGA